MEQRKRKQKYMKEQVAPVARETIQRARNSCDLSVPRFYEV
jgi:hypothetical protein